MKKKIQPGEQTRELNKALFEFLKRNKNKFEEFLEKSEIESILALCERYNTTQETIEDMLSEGIGRPAIIDSDPCFKAYSRAFNRAEKKHDLWKQGPYLPSEIIKDMDQFGDLYLEELVKDSKNIIKSYMSERPLEHLLVSIDLSRSTEVILSEIKAKIRNSKYEIKETRLKWLPKVDELLEVWDLYDLAGQQPAKKTFKQIAKRVGRPLSTVKDQWHLAHIKIMGKKYDPESKYATEEKKAMADELCARCPHDAKCYRKGDQSPCADWLKIAGKERQYPNNLEFKDEIYK